MNGLEIGDIVELKSGGVKMMVKYLNYPHEGEIQCEWFVDNQNKIGNFNPTMLIKVKNE